MEESTCEYKYELEMTEASKRMRSEIQILKAVLKTSINEAKQYSSSGSECDKGEVIANLTLAYRHLEDARMRMGLVFQAIDGGESCYDK